jgi:hypothetical protein
MTATVTTSAADARVARARQRQEAQADQVRRAWQENLDRTRSLMDCQELQTLLEGNQLGDRELWLVLGVFETEERHAAIGRNISVKTYQMDNIAPRARGLGFGVSGFTTRTAAKLPTLLRASGNGYIYLMDLGYALVQQLRYRNSSLDDTQDIPREIALTGYCIPRPAWRHWNPRH